MAERKNYYIGEEENPRATMMMMMMMGILYGNRTQIKQKMIVSNVYKSCNKKQQQLQQEKRCRNL
jgi:hypothetical protein